MDTFSLRRNTQKIDVVIFCVLIASFSNKEGLGN